MRGGARARLPQRVCTQPCEPPLSPGCSPVMPCSWPAQYLPRLSLQGFPGSESWSPCSARLDSLPLHLPSSCHFQGDSGFVLLRGGADARIVLGGWVCITTRVLACGPAGVLGCEGQQGLLLPKILSCAPSQSCPPLLLRFPALPSLQYCPSQHNPAALLEREWVSSRSARAEHHARRTLPHARMQRRAWCSAGFLLCVSHAANPLLRCMPSLAPRRRAVSGPD
jgi:hypothetical protein